MLLEKTKYEGLYKYYINAEDLDGSIVKYVVGVDPISTRLNISDTTASILSDIGCLVISEMGGGRLLVKARFLNKIKLMKYEI